MVAAVVLQPPWFPTPGAAAFDNQPTCWVTVLFGGAASGLPWRLQLTTLATTRRWTFVVVVGCGLGRNT
jgi:hypothetical protein